jgi:hypothetical protein
MCKGRFHKFDANGTLVNVDINLMETLKLPLNQNDFIM